MGLQKRISTILVDNREKRKTWRRFVDERPNFDLGFGQKKRDLILQPDNWAGGLFLEYNLYKIRLLPYK
ncbi:hypothetical protein OOU_Y34scaffold00129g2 [Pyricularia oryzae Y34]|uniref:Uncharacterized protein n=1 Tax=Pyricularia oryzae (strain Y34) TaxID=1143189 RepID=A0AA97P891_PYRO3|nr:hypothetical protein OOU_Y34scaffold00129g2 [Pyricularia oryzae Y34]